jgi:hypothetical protein
MCIYPNEQEPENCITPLKKCIVFLPLFAFVSLLVTAQTTVQEQPAELIPTVALIGEYEEAFAALAQENPGILLGVCGNDMDIAYDKWTDMLVAMEDYAE